MGCRQSLNALPAGDRQRLINLILQYLNDGVVAVHIMITHSEEHIFSRHRQHLEQLEILLTAQGSGWFVLLPGWNPANPIPPAFNVVKPQDNGALRPTLVNLNPNCRCRVSTHCPQCATSVLATDLSSNVNGWHGTVHITVGGTRCQLPTRK